MALRTLMLVLEVRDQEVIGGLVESLLPVANGHLGAEF